MESQQILNFIDRNSSVKPKRIFLMTRNADMDVKKPLERLYMKLSLVLNRLKPTSGDFAPKAIKFLNAIIYKYGHAYKHHMFMRRAKHSYSLAKKLSNDTVFPLIKSFASGLSDSSYEYALTSEAIDHLRATILYRILILDKLRIVCAKNIEFSIGYVELRHNVNLNLLFIALAAELGQKALEQIHLLVKTHNDLFKYFTTFFEMPISRLNDLPVSSFEFDEQSAIIERSTGENCDLGEFVSFLDKADISEDKLDEFELTKLDEIYEILRNRSKTMEDKREKEVEVFPNFYREVPVNKGRKRKKNRK